MEDRGAHSEAVRRLTNLRYAMSFGPIVVVRDDACSRIKIGRITRVEIEPPMSGSARVMLVIVDEGGERHTFCEDFDSDDRLVVTIA